MNLLSDLKRRLHGPALGLAVCGLLALVGAVDAAPQDPRTNVIGFSEPVETIDLSAAEAGVVEEMRVKEGDSVKSGQLMGRLDSGVLEATLKIAQNKAKSDALVKTATTKVELRRSRLSKLRQLASSQNANPEELERAAADLDIGEAELESAVDEKKASVLEVERIQQSINRRTFRSPIDGVVTRVLRDVAESVDARADHVLTVVNLARLRVVVYVEPQAALRIKAQKELAVRPLEGGPERKATVEFVSPVTEPASGTVRVKLLVDNAEGLLISGTKFSVTLP